MAGRLFKGKFLGSWDRGRALWGTWVITVLSRGPEIPGGRARPADAGEKLFVLLLYERCR